MMTHSIGYERISSATAARWLALALLLFGCAQPTATPPAGEGGATPIPPDPVQTKAAPEAAAEKLAPGWHRRTFGGGGGQAGIAIHPTDPRIVYVTTDNAGMLKSVDGGESWFPINHNLGSRTLGDSQLDPLDPQVLYVAAEVTTRSWIWSDDPVNGELYRTRDGGQSWEVVYAEGMGPRAFGVAAWPSTQSIVIPHDAADPRRYDADGDQLSDVIYIGGWDNDDPNPDKRAGLWKSTDEGATFDQIALNDKNIWSLKADPRGPERLYAATFGDGVWVSGDGGLTWESWRDRIPNPMTSDITIDPVSGALYVTINSYFRDEFATRNGAYKSVDGGRTFFSINWGLERTDLDLHRIWLDVADPTGQTLYTGTFSSNWQGMYVTRDGGANWELMPLETTDDPEWLDELGNLWDIAQGPDGTLFVTTWRGIYRRDAKQTLWELKINGLGNVAVRSVVMEPGNSAVVYAGVMDALPKRSQDWGRTWETLDRGFVTTDGKASVSALDYAIFPDDPRIVYAVGIGSSTRYTSAVLKSEDRGASWRPIAAGLPPTSTADPQWQATAIAVDALNQDVAYVSLDIKPDEGAIYKTTDGGKRWNEILRTRSSFTDLALTASSPGTLVSVTAEGGVFVSEDAGATWRSSNLDDLLLYTVDVSTLDPQRILVGANVAGAFLSRDGGRTWNRVFDQHDLDPLTRGLALSPFARTRYAATLGAVKFDPRNADVLYLGHEPGTWMGVGVIVSTDAGQSWSVMEGEEFQVRSVNSIDIDPVSNNLVVGAFELYYYAPGVP